ncbi:MAG TPA: hypothetical protein VHP31_12330 [Caproicibacter sp.]|nr:hypothetical protein [Caproicibacter sp.]
MSTSKTTTKLGLPLPQPGDKPDWYDLGALCQLLENLFGAVNGFATLDKDGNAVQMPAGAVPNTRKILGNPLSGDITLAQFIAAGLCPAPEIGNWTLTIHGSNIAGSPVFTVAYANYCKLGKYVYIEAGITLSSKGGMTGWLQIGGLPFASAYENRLGIHRVSGISGISGPIVPVILGNTITPISESSVGSAWDVTADKITDTFSFALSGMYRAV